MKVYIRKIHGAKKIKEHKLFFLLLFAFLTVAVIVVLTKILASENGGEKEIHVKAENGVYNLTKIQNTNGHGIVLAPDESYYPNNYLTPNSIDTASSESVDKYSKIKAQYLSQRFAFGKW